MKEVCKPYDLNNGGTQSVKGPNVNAGPSITVVKKGGK